jgi:MiaB-like tRNA modifying enzyme
MEKVLIETYGCTLNHADSDMIEGILSKKEILVEHGKYDQDLKNDYDFVIINTCTVKKATEQKIIERLKSLNHLGKRLVITGCMASANPDLIENAVPSASIISTGNTSKVFDALTSIKENGRVHYEGNSHTDKSLNIPDFGLTIARIPISEGCLSSCSFCETKFARGPLNSFSEKLILKAIDLNVRKGSKEIELTSQDIGAYGADRGTDIAELLEKASKINGDFMIRVGMLNPEHLHKYLDRLLNAYKSEKVYKFIHLPVQSGSDKILQAMGRRYTVKEFEEYIKAIRLKFPEMCIATDVIVGYPGETINDFKATFKLLDRLRITITNISKFGARPHANAAKLKQTKGDTIKARSLSLSRTVKKMQHENFSSYLNKNVMVLLTESSGKSITGRTASYIPVAVLDAEKSDLGKWINVKITGNSYACIIGQKRET